MLIQFWFAIFSSRSFNNNGDIDNDSNNSKSNNVEGVVIFA